MESVQDDDRCPWISQLLDRQGVKIIEDDTNFIFQFETDGSYKAIDVLQYAIYLPWKSSIQPIPLKLISSFH